jgi:uncharacterized protein YdeI (YjbR/CyaY-like superfamily)
MASAMTIAAYFDNLVKWKEEILYLREIVLSMDLEETIKWGAPCYMYKGKNIMGLADFKSYTCIWFFQGALLKDEKQYLVSGNKDTVAMRQWRFHSMSEIKKAPIKAYIKETMAHFDAGIKIPLKQKTLIVPEELEKALKQNKILSQQWAKLSPSCKREYADYIGSAKKEETRLSRLNKMIPMIIEAKSMHEKYMKK